MAGDESQDTCETANIADGGKTLTPETLVRKYASVVLGVCLAHTNNFHDSEDIMQDVFLKAVKKFDTLRHHSRARAWLLKITRRKCIDYYRNSEPTQKMPADLPASINGVTEQINRLHEAISKLPEGFREPITLYYLDGKKCANVAKTLGISEDAVRSRLVRARLRLHELLLEEKQ